MIFVTVVSRTVCVPDYKSFERFINHTLKESIQTIAKEIYLYVQDEKALEEQILYNDGTKFEANANKMTFCWKGWSKRYLQTLAEMYGTVKTSESIL